MTSTHHREIDNAVLAFDQLQAGGGSSMPFNPASLAGLKAWYRRGVEMAVGRWADQSTSGADFIQGTATNQPSVTGDRTLSFDGIDNYMSATLTLAQPFTIYGLVNAVTWTGTDQLLSGSGAFIRQQTATPNIAFNSGSSIGEIAPVLNTVNVISVVGNGASSVIQLNNDTPITGNAGVGAFNNPVLAASQTPALYARTDNWEWLFYSGAHSAGERAAVISYLASVGGLSI